MIFHIARFATHDGPGIRTTVFLKGCPLECWWCHNPESLSPNPQAAWNESRCIRCGNCETLCPTGARDVVGQRVTAGEVMALIERDVPFYEESGGGVTFSGGEPLMQHEFLENLLVLCGRAGIHRAVDTSGYAPRKVFTRIAGLTDLFLYDLKLMNLSEHRKYTGVDNERILSNLEYLASSKLPVRVRIPLIPGINDAPGNLEAAGAFLRKLGLAQVDLLPYHNRMASKYARIGETCRMPPGISSGDGALEEAERILSSCGLTVTIGGNPGEREN